MARTKKKDITPQDILLAVLPDVVFDGWTETLFDVAAKKLSCTRADIDNVLPNGLTDLCLAFSHWADAEMLKTATPKKLTPMKIRERIAYGVMARLEALNPHKEAVQESIKYMSIPPRSLKMPKMVWTTADHLWWAAGDTATDYNHYTKRILLSGIITSTTLYWLRDTSENNDKTRAFLDHRIAEVLKIGQKIASFKNMKKAS